MASTILIIGAGPAGLAAGAALRQRGLRATVLEAGTTIGNTWHVLYERLHLHTVKGLSGLPGYPMPRRYPRYPSRAEVAAYLVDYARHFDLEIRTGSRAERAWREGDSWHVATAQGGERADIVIAATGIFSQPVRPVIPGADRYHGQQLHASAYRLPAPFAGQRVLVIGAGNSGAEIAVDLAEHGARPTVAIRAGTNVVPRELLGIPIQRWAHLIARMPRGVSRAIAPVMVSRAARRQARAGVPRAAQGLLERSGIPIIGLEFLEMARTGAIAITGAVTELTEHGARFTDGHTADFDTIISATGYRPALDFLANAIPLDGAGRPALVGQRAADAPNLYFTGLHSDIRGTLFNIAHEAPAIAAAIAD